MKRLKEKATVGELIFAFIAVFIILGTIEVGAQQILKPVKGGLELKIWDQSFTTSDSNDNRIYFQFGDGTDISYDIKKSPKQKFKKVIKKINKFEYFHVKTGAQNSLQRNGHSGWRLYKYFHDGKLIIKL